MKPRLIIEQQITVLANRYAIYRATPEGNKGNLMAFAQQKRLSSKEKVSFYSDESKSQLVFTFRAEKVVDLHGKFFVEDAEGDQIGIFRKAFKRSLVSSTWHIIDKDDVPQITLTESSAILAFIRRAGGFIPILGELIEFFVLFFKYHFLFTDATGQEVGKYTKTTVFRDHYTLSMTDEAYQSQDWRVIASVAVALDALQGR